MNLKLRGDDLIFFKAKTFVEPHKLILSSKNVKRSRPKYVRYAWSDTPYATLFNSENHPAFKVLIYVGIEITFNNNVAIKPFIKHVIFYRLILQICARSSAG